MSERIRSMQLGVDKMLALEARIAELEAENAKLRACVEAADAYFQADANSLMPIEPKYTEQQIEESEHWLSVAVKHRDDYVAARAGVDRE